MELVNSFLKNWDLFTVGVVIIMMVMFGFIVFFNDIRSHTNRYFFGFALSTAIWGTFNYLSKQSQEFIPAFLGLRLTIFTVVWMCYFFLSFSLTFPKEKINLRPIILLLFRIWTFLVSILTLTPFVFEKVGSVSSSGVITSVINGPALPIFGTTTVGYLLSGIVILSLKTIKARGSEKKYFLLITTGVVIMFVSLVIFNFLLPAFFDNSSYLSFGSLFIFPFVTLTGYAIAKGAIFHIKIISTTVFITAFLLLSLFQLVQSPDITATLIQGGVFLGLLGVGVLLNRSVQNEVKQREELEILTSKLKKTAKDLSISNTKLEEANQKLKELDQAKSEFMSIASHQLRTPLTGIAGYLSMILNGDYGRITPQLQQVIKEMNDASQRLVRLVNTFLNVTRIEAGRLTLNITSVNLVEHLIGEVHELQPTADQKGLRLDFHGPTPPIITAEVDADKMRDVFLNLIDNAIKYTPHGSITVTITTEQDPAGQATAHLTVRDTGVGIHAHEAENLFQKFVRGSGIARVQPNGSGLGLFIVKKMVEAHQGKVWVESAGPGKGSTFHVVLPLVQPKSEAVKTI